MSDDALDTITARIAAVSPDWADAIEHAGEAARRAPALDGQLGLGVESIYEGHALHRSTGRLLAADASPALQLLVGDYCYAAGLCDVAATGDLDAVATLADLIADTATLAAEPSGDARDGESNWDDAITQLMSRP